MKYLFIAIAVYTVLMYAIFYPLSPEPVKAERIYPEAHSVTWWLDYDNWGHDNDRTKTLKGLQP